MLKSPQMLGNVRRLDRDDLRRVREFALECAQNLPQFLALQYPKQEYGDGDAADPRYESLHKYSDGRVDRPRLSRRGEDHVRNRAADHGGGERFEEEPPEFRMRNGEVLHETY